MKQSDGTAGAKTQPEPKLNHPNAFLSLKQLNDISYKPRKINIKKWNRPGGAISKPNPPNTFEGSHDKTTILKRFS
jgi:hypothetical protein